VFGILAGGLALLLGLLFVLLIHGSRAAVLESTERLFGAAAREIEERLARHLAGAEEAVRDFETELRSGTVQPDDPLSVESALFAALLRRPDLAEATLTTGTLIGDEEGGAARLAEAGRGQISVARSPAGGIATRRVHQEEGGFVADVRDRAVGAGLLDAPLARAEGPPPEDPSRHLTFRTPASAPFRGRLLWSDLHRSALDADLPEERRRVVVAVQKAIETREGTFAGVLRVSLTADRLDRLTAIRIGRARGPDPHRIFLCDRDGRLIAPGGRLEETPNGLRVRADDVPADIARALAQPALAEPASEEAPRLVRFAGGGTNYLLALRLLPSTQDWVIGILVPEEYYLGDLAAMRRRLLAAALVLMTLIVAAGGAALRAVGRSLGQIVAEAGEVRSFHFAAASRRSVFREVREVLESLERAKTALRALGKYVPVDLVRELYEDGREPRLGGELREVSVMFTDVKDFTAFAEALPPDELASVMGDYFEAMTRAVHGSRGIVDKYIGDAVMALWNAPTRAPDHPLLACRTALACLEAERGLQATPAWAGRPRIATRVGLHRDVVMVGHFGAPDRINYTAMGDGVNLASRLEGLNKHYGTSIIASEAVVEVARDAFSFRLLDRVAVKGKAKGVRIYELLGSKGPRDPVFERYEHALAAYFARDFVEAATILEAQLGDGPSRALRERCEALRRSPPPEDWEGVFAFTAK
jgi:adenylate cyclase